MSWTQNESSKVLFIFVYSPFCHRKNDKIKSFELAKMDEK